MRAYLIGAAILGLVECAPSSEEASDAIEPVVTTAWDAVRIGTYNNSEFARLFTEIGGYEVVGGRGNILALQQNGVGARIILEEMAGTAPQARPPDAQSWEPGCYWSLMMRAKDIPSIVEDAKPLGWLPRTEVAYLEFGPSKLNIVVLTHQETGAQVQLYERLTTPLPEDYPDFERFGVPFNIMQMVSDVDVTYEFFTEKLGFATFYRGEPFVSPEPGVMPLGIPPELTTTVPYQAAIVSPVEGMETGRFEMIQVMGEAAGLTGRDFSETCHNDAVGLTHVRYEVVDLYDWRQQYFNNTRITGPLIERRDDYGEWRLTEEQLIAPDGANVIFSPN